MPRQFYSDKYIKHKRGAEKDEDIMMRQKFELEQENSEYRQNKLFREKEQQKLQDKQTSKMK